MCIACKQIFVATRVLKMKIIKYLFIQAHFTAVSTLLINLENSLI